MDSEAIVLNLTNATSACVISPAGGVEEYIYLVLPVRSL